MSKKKLFENGIAIIGFSGRFPGADSCAQFWENLCAGKESVTFFDNQTLFKEGVAKELLDNPNYIKASPVLNNVTDFDANFYNFSPREAIALDPQQRIFLELCTEALEVAGYFGNNDPTIGVYAGSGDVISNYLLSYLKCYPEIEQRSGSFQHLANDKDYLASRVSYKLDLNGPSISVQTACSTSLVAVHLACQAILDGECDMALAGGVNVRVPQHQGYFRQEGDIFSSDGHVRTFDEKADGVLFGSGAGVVVLKSLEQAVADNDLIYAYIRGTAVNNDGGNKLSYTASSYMGQVNCIEKAILVAEIPPESLQYIEAHGTATRMGDPIEMSALGHVLGKDAKNMNFCGIGSVKSNVGHLDAAAGITGLIKSVLMLHHRYMPATINYTKPNPRLKLEQSPFYVVSTGREWAHGVIPRRCGVNSLGIGGTNAFIVLEEAPISNARDERIHLPKENIFVVSAKSQYSLERLIAAYRDYLVNTNDLLADICYTAAIGRRHFHFRLALVVVSKEDLLEQLSSSVQQIHQVYLSEDVVSSNDLRELHIAYLSGKSLNWDDYYAPYVRALRKVSLPTYQFDRQRYWVDIKKKQGVSHGISAHELLGARLPGYGNDIRFLNSLSACEPGYLKSHHVLGTVLMSGAGFIESALAAGREVQGSLPISLSQVTFLRPMEFAAEVVSDYQVSLLPGMQSYTGRIDGHAQDDESEWVEHVNFELVLESEPVHRVVDLAVLKSDKTAHEITGLYARFAASGLNYGPEFQVIREAYVGPQSALVLVEMQENLSSAAYCMHPTLLDGAFQAIALLSHEQGTYIPSIVDALTCYQNWGSRVWVEILLLEADSHTVKADIRVYDEQGILLSSIEGFRARVVDRRSMQLMLNQSKSAERYIEGFERYNPPSWIDSDASVLVYAADEIALSDYSGWTSAAVETVDWSGHSVVVVYEGDLAGLVVLAQRALKEPPLNLILLVRGAFAVTDDEVIDPVHREALGFWRTVSHEAGGQACYLVDASTLAEAYAVLSLIVRQELPEPELIVRGASVYVPRLYREEEALRRAHRLSVPDSGQYLVSDSGIDTLYWAHRPKQALGAHEVRVDLETTALNFRDVLHAMHLYPGEAGDLGYEASGRILEAGKEVTDLRPGDSVVVMGNGLLSREVVVDAVHVCALPACLSATEGAGIPIVFLTVNQALNQLAQLHKGQKVLIHAATGGVGLAAIQFASLVGAEIYATASNSKQAYLREVLGIKHVYDSRSTDFGAAILADTEGLGVDVVLNSLTGKGFIESSVACLKEGGFFLEIGKLNTYSPEQMSALRPDIRYHQIALDARMVEEPAVIKAELGAILDLFSHGQLTPLPTKEFAISDCIAAFHYLQQAHHIGKVVVNYPPRFCYKPDATYLITGGTGGLGWALARHLIEQGVTHLALTSRSAANELFEAWMWEQNQAGIEVRHYPVDVADKQALSGVFDAIATSGHPLKGIFHTAGVVHDGMLMNLHAADFNEVAAPKVSGSQYLDALSRQCDLDCFVLFSSVVSLLGSSGQSNYAAANAYMDGLAQLRRQQGLPALSINWGPFASVGMAAHLVATHSAQGLLSLHTSSAFQLMDELLTAAPAQLGVMRMNWQKMAAAPYLSYLVEVKTTRADDWLALLESTPTAQREQVLSGKLQHLLAEVLSIQDVSHIESTKGFFYMGMDSLMAVEFKNKLQQRLADGVHLSNTVAFDYNSVRALTGFLLESLHFNLDADMHVTSHKKVISPLVKRQRANFLPVSFMQKYWLYRQIFADLRTFMLTLGVELAGVLDKIILEKSIHLLIQRHESLRTSFEYKNGDLLQVIHDNVPFQLSYKTIEKKDAKQKQELINTYVRDSNCTVCDYKKGFLMDLVFVNVMDKSSVLILSIHHLCADALSLYLALNELQEIYNNLLVNRQQNAEAALIQYADFSEWQREFYTLENLAEHKKFWTGYLKDSKALALPYDKECSEVDPEGGIVKLICDKVTKDQIVQFAGAMGVTAFIVCFMGFLTMSAAESQQIDMTLSVPQSGREFSELQNMIGFIASTCLVRHELDPGLSVQSAITALSQNFQKVLTYYLPYYNVSSFAANESMNLSYNILFEFLPHFNKENTLFGFPVIERLSPATVLGHDMIWCISYDNQALSVSVSFDRKKYKKETVVHFMKRWEHVIQLMMDKPTLSIGHIMNYEKK